MRGLEKFMNEEKRTLVKVTPPRDNIASSKASFSKGEYECILLEWWWANYDPGMDAYLLSRAFSTNPDSPYRYKEPKVYTSTYCDIPEA